MVALGALGVMEARVPFLSQPPHSAEAAEWDELPYKPWEDPVWFPLWKAEARRLGQPTLYDVGGPLDIYDSLSTLVGEQTSLRQKAWDLADWYFKRYPNLSPVLRDTTGFCHGVANAAAWGEPEPLGDRQFSRITKLGILAAKHSGDWQYKPGIEQLMEDLVVEKRPFVVETIGSDGFWSRVALGVNIGRGLIRATNFAKGIKELHIDDIYNAYYPVSEEEIGNYPPGTVEPPIGPVEVLERWTFRLDRRLVNYINYGEPLSQQSARVNLPRVLPQFSGGLSSSLSLE